MRAHLASPVVGRIHSEASGEPGSPEWRLNFFSGAEPISPWHDIPYKNEDGSYNVVIEIPRWTRRKFEIATGERLNPIKQVRSRRGGSSARERLVGQLLAWCRQPAPQSRGQRRQCARRQCARARYLTA